MFMAFLHMKRKLKTLLLFFLVNIMIFTSSVFNFASVYSAEPTKVYNDVILKVGYIDYIGFIEKNNDGSFSGYAVEYLNKISKYTGWKYEYVFDTWENQLKNLAEGKIDILCQAQKTEERENLYDFSKNSAGIEYGVLYTTSGNDKLNYNDFSSLEGIKVAELKDSYQNRAFEDYAKKKGFLFQPIVYTNEYELFEALDRGDVDAVSIGSLSVKRNDLKLVALYDVEPYYFILRKNSPYTESLNDAMVQILAYSPYYQDSLYQKYYTKNRALRKTNYTAEEIEYLKNCGTIEVGFYQNNPPMSTYNSKTGEFSGIDVDVIKLIAQNTGLNFNMIPIPNGVHESEFIAGNKNRCVAGSLISPVTRMSDNLVYSESYFNASGVFVGKKDYDYMERDHVKIAASSFVDLSYENMKNTFKNSEYTNYDDALECLESVKSGESDIALITSNVAYSRLEEKRFSDLSIIPAYALDEDRVITFDKNVDYNLVSVIDKSIVSFDDNVIEQMIMNNEVSKPLNDTLLSMYENYKVSFWIIVGLLLLLFMLLALIIYIRNRSLKRMKVAKDKLEAAYQQADIAIKAKNSFLARISHEIRTPMNAIIGMTNLAESRLGNDEAVGDCLDKIGISSKVLLSLINDVLDMSAIENEKIKISNNEFNISEVLSSLISIYKVQCQQKQIDFVTEEKDFRFNYLVGDKLRINQIILNLLSNAVKFTNNGGKIQFLMQERVLSAKKLDLILVVKDSGCGMTDETALRIFEPFEQESPDTALKHGGSGLGLAIVKNLVELMNGTITVKSERYIGSEFRVVIPLKYTTKKKEKYLEKTKKKDNNLSLNGKHVLIVEDNEINIEIVVELLKMAGVESDCAMNGQEAIEMYFENNNKYDAILMDIQMPILNGYRATEAIRASGLAGADTIPIIAMTANVFNEDIENAKNVGMNAHVSKPIDPDVLYSTLEMFIK